jgi:NADH dehydrogenase FAD-containing subunit
MTEQRNIVILGASAAGLQSSHYLMKHILPSLKQHKKEAKYHVYLINPSTTWWFRPASPRAAASTTRLSAEKLVLDIRPGLAQYSKDDITFIEGTATSLDDAARQVTFVRAGSAKEEALPYHALIVATGSSTYHNAFSMNGDAQTTLDSIKLTNEKVRTAKDIVIVGGGPTAVEFAGEVAEFRNGKPGWFSSVSKKTNITLITSASQLLPVLSPSLAKAAETKLAAMGVEVRYNTRVVDTSASGERTKIHLAKGESLEADLYVPAHGVSPNTSFVPGHLLDEKKYLRTNPKTLRVDDAGPRVYALGDVGSYSRNDLLAYDTAQPDAKPKGKDREYLRDERAVQLVPLGTSGGVGAIMGWKVPSFAVWLIKGRDYMLGMENNTSGEAVKKEIVWTKEEAVV